MKKVLKALTIIICISLIYITYGIVRSYGWPVVNTYEISSNKIQESKRICVIGDLHSKNFSSLAEQVRNEQPDFIVMAGDIFDASDVKLDPTFKVIDDLKQICPVYFAMGNHELRLEKSNSQFMKRLETCGVKIIEKCYFDVGSDLRVGGLYDYPFGWDKGGYNTADSAPDSVQQFLNDFVDTERFTLFTAHRPDSFYYGNASKEYTIDLVISAHVHGGQVVIPFKGGLHGGDQGWWPKYVHGYYEKNNIKWLITSGLSTSKKALPRFNNPPEIMMIDLIPDRNS